MYKFTKVGALHYDIVEDFLEFSCCEHFGVFWIAEVPDLDVFRQRSYQRLNYGFKTKKKRGMRISRKIRETNEIQ